jgi:hypothetical protein
MRVKVAFQSRARKRTTAGGNAVQKYFKINVPRIPNKLRRLQDPRIRAEFQPFASPCIF